MRGRVVGERASGVKGVKEGGGSATRWKVVRLDVGECDSIQVVHSYPMKLMNDKAIFTRPDGSASTDSYLIA